MSITWNNLNRFINGTFYFKKVKQDAKVDDHRKTKVDHSVATQKENSYDLGGYTESKGCVIGEKNPTLN